jgi:putative addiction module component (TIGR02574 family)
MPPSVLPELLELPRRTRLAIAERLWLSVADEDSLPVPAGHKRILRTRLAGYRAGHIKAVSHAELMRRVRRSA